MQSPKQKFQTGKYKGVRTANLDALFLALLDAIFKALSDSTRRLIIDELSECNEQTLYELTVRLITKHNLNISRQAIAKHISALDDAGLVQSKRKGKYRVLMINKEPLKNLLKGWIEEFK